MRLVMAALGVAAWVAVQPAPAVTTWRLNNLQQFAQDGVERLGSPAVVQTEIGPAVQFNGVSDALLIARNPIAGLQQFTVEVLLSPDAEGPVEQRFFHIQERSAENRALLELRLNGGRWALDTYLRYGTSQLTLLDPARTQPASTWHVAALTYDGRRMVHYVDGVEQASGEVAFTPLTEGQVSIGARQNRVSWFKGRIHTIRVTPSALAPADST